MKARPIAGLPPLREVIARHGLSANKALGQNFLLDSQLLDRIARVPGPLDGETVYEVGPGPGGLTRALLEAGANVVAVERDDRCLPALAELNDASGGRLRILSADAMKIDERAEAGDGAHIASNLPYNVGTALFVRWMTLTEWTPWWKSLTLMFQREVADRIVAGPDSDAYGRLSVLAQWRAKPVLAMTVHRSAFVPPPKVMSAIIHVVPTEQPAGVSMKMIETLTAAAFGQRRKMLRQSLKSVPGAVEMLAQVGIAAERRAETVSVDEFVALGRALEA